MAVRVGWYLCKQLNLSPSVLNVTTWNTAKVSRVYHITLSREKKAIHAFFFIESNKDALQWKRIKFYSWKKMSEDIKFFLKNIFDKVALPSEILSLERIFETQKKARGRERGFVTWNGKRLIYYNYANSGGTVGVARSNAYSQNSPDVKNNLVFATMKNFITA